VKTERLKEILKYTWPELEKRNLTAELLELSRGVSEGFLPLLIKKTPWERDLVEAFFIEFARTQVLEQDFGPWSFLNPSFQVFKFEYSSSILKKNGVHALWKFNSQLFDESFSLEQAWTMDLLKDTDFQFWKEMIPKLPVKHQEIISVFKSKGIISLS
jgi:uncharacterized protein (DUF2132 family)